MAAEAVVEEVAQNLEEAAQLTRKINTKGLGIFLGGLGVGLAVGFYFGHRFNREKIRAEAFRESEEEVEKIREVYRQKAVASQEKPTVDEVIAERGYSTKAAEEVRPLKPPVPISGAPVVVTRETEVIITDPDWVYERELAARTPDRPYVIHQDEFIQNELEYNQVAYTYYAEDDVLADEDDHPVAHGDIVVGSENLKFGHGSGDANVVFVRNDKLRLEMEIIRSPKSYEQEVMGLEHESN